MNLKTIQLNLSGERRNFAFNFDEDVFVELVTARVPVPISDEGIFCSCGTKISKENLRDIIETKIAVLN